MSAISQNKPMPPAPTAYPAAQAAANDDDGVTYNARIADPELEMLCSRNLIAQVFGDIQRAMALDDYSLHMVSVMAMQAAIEHAHYTHEVFAGKTPPPRSWADVRTRLRMYVNHAHTRHCEYVN